MRAPHLHDTLRRFCLGAFAVFTRDLEDGVDLPVRVRGARHVRPADALRVPAARARLRRGAGRAALRAGRRPGAVADLLREPAARIFAHAHEGDVQRRAARRLPQRARAAAGAHRRGLRRLRLGRHRLRARVRGARGLALRRGPLVRRGRAAGRPLGRHADRARRRDPRARRRHGRARGDVARGGGLLPRNFGREPDRICVLELERSLASGTNEAPDAPGELADAITAIRLATAAPVAAGPVLFERLDWRPLRDPSRAADRGDGSARRADAARSVPRLGRERRARPARRRPTTTRTSATLSTAGSWRSSSRSRSAASSSATRSRPRSGRATAPGRPRCAVPLCSARLRTSAPTSREKLREPTCELLRRLLVAVLLHGDRRALVRDLDEALLGVTGAVASLQQRAS